MKKMVVSFVLVMASLTAFGQIESAADDLASTMRKMSNDLKAIASQMDQPASNSQSAMLADDFVKAVKQAKAFVPDSVASLPKAEQAARLVVYTGMLDKAASLGTQLATALRANDSAQAHDLLSQLSQAKKGGHSEFKD